MAGVIKKATAKKRTARTARRDARPAEAGPSVSGALVVVLDMGGRIIRWNETFEAACGRRRRLAGHPAQDIIMPGEKAGRLLRMLEAVAMGHGGTTFEVSLPVANGRPRTILWTATDCRDAGGKVKQVVCAGIDVTADQKIRRVAEERQRELLHTYRLHSAGGLAAALAHEVGQPLAALVSYCEAGRQSLEHAQMNRERLVRNLECAVREAHRAAGIIRELRGFLGKDKAHPEKFRLDTVIAAAVQLVEPSAHARGIHIDLQLKKRLPPLKGRSLQIEQLLLNLLTNAIDAARSEHGRITITTQRDVSAAMARVSVADNGPGLDAEVARRLFNPFYTTKKGGLGIGLMIARSIAEAHGGSLWAEPAPGGGTIFHFTAPFWH